MNSIESRIGSVKFKQKRNTITRTASLCAILNRIFFFIKLTLISIGKKKKKKKNVPNNNKNITNLQKKTAMIIAAEKKPQQQHCANHFL